MENKYKEQIFTKINGNSKREYNGNNTTYNCSCQKAKVLGSLGQVCDKTSGSYENSQWSSALLVQKAGF